MRETILSTRNLTKKYGSTAALSNVSLEVKQGDIYGLVGKNGAGKTTLLRLISGQAFSSEGEISLFEQTSASGINQGRKRIGSIIETPSFYANLTAEENLEYYRIQRGIPGKDCIEEALQEVGLTNTGKKKYKSFSLGMKQRLGLALALLNKPELLLLDEPINGLDPFGIVEIRNLLIRLNQEKNITILISSHILSELSSLVTSYGFIDKGVLVKQLSSEELSMECGRYIELKVDQTEAMTALLETKLRTANYKVTPDYSIHLFDYMNESYKVSELAVTNGIRLHSLTVKEIKLEDYFIQLVGGESND